MKKLSEIISAIKKPLIFASRHQFANLDTVKELEYHINNLAVEALALPLKLEDKAIFNNILTCFEGFDALDNEHKKERIEGVFNLLSKEQETVLSENNLSDTETECAGVQQLSTPMQFIKGVGPRLSELLGKKGINTVGDALYFMPRKYEDRRKIKKISSITSSAIETIKGKIIMLDVVPYMRGRKRIFEMAVSDGTGTIVAKWFRFNERYMKKRFKNRKQVMLSGEVNQKKKKEEFHFT